MPSCYDTYFMYIKLLKNEMIGFSFVDIQTCILKLTLYYEF